MLVNVCDLTPAQAVRSISDIGEECEVSRWGADPALARADVSACSLVICRNVADLGAAERDHTISDQVRERLLPLLSMVQENSAHLLHQLEYELGHEATTGTPGWLTVVEVLEALVDLGQLGGLLWGDGCDSTAEVVA